MTRDQEINELAKVLWAVWNKRTKTTELKWGRLTPEERSPWRHVAKAAFAHFENVDSSDDPRWADDVS